MSRLGTTGGHGTEAGAPGISQVGGSFHIARASRRVIAFVTTTPWPIQNPDEWFATNPIVRAGVGAAGACPACSASRPFAFGPRLVSDSLSQTCETGGQSEAAVSVTFCCWRGAGASTTRRETCFGPARYSTRSVVSPVCVVRRECP